MNRAARHGWLATVLAGVVLAGCIPLLPRPEAGSRTNLPDTVPAAIRAGESTRADVLHALGQPDACAVNESWMMFSSGRSKGGLLLVGPGPGGGAMERMRYQRLLVQFDERGTVTNAFTESADCWVSWTSSSDPMLDLQPCVDLSGRDIPGKFHWAPRREQGAR